MELVRVTAHGGVILLNEEPSHLILGDVTLLIGGSDISRGGRLNRLEAGGIVHGDGSVIVRLRVAVLGRVVAVDGNLVHIGHVVGLRGFVGFGLKMRLRVTERGENKGETIRPGKLFFDMVRTLVDLMMECSFPSLMLN